MKPQILILLLHDFGYIWEIHCNNIDVRVHLIFLYSPMIVLEFSFLVYFCELSIGWLILKHKWFLKIWFLPSIDMCHRHTSYLWWSMENCSHHKCIYNMTLFTIAFHVLWSYLVFPSAVLNSAAVCYNVARVKIGFKWDFLAFITLPDFRDLRCPCYWNASWPVLWNTLTHR